MLEIWKTLSEGQGSVVAALLTIVAAIVGVLLGGAVFRHQVMDLKSALLVAKDDIEDYRAHVEKSLINITDKLRQLEATNFEGIGRLEGSVADLKSASIQEVSKEEKPNTASNRETISAKWTEIRNKLEETAANPEIDGRTRARYFRIDRRSYNDLLDALEYDGKIHRPHLFRRAIEIWHKYRSGRVAPTEGDAEEMQRLLDEILKNRLT